MRRFGIFKRTAPAEAILYIFVSILFALVSLSYIYIFVFSLISGAKTHTEVIMQPFALPETWHWDHFTEVFSTLKIGDNGFWSMTFNSVYFSIVSSFLGIYVTMTFAYCCTKYKFKGSEMVYTVVMIMITLPIYGGSGARYRLLWELGLIDSYAYVLTACSGFGITYGKKPKDDYFYHTENPRIYEFMTFPVDYIRSEKDAMSGEFDAVAGNRWADPGVVGERIGASPYQPFPAILISNYQSNFGLVHGTLSQDVCFHNYLVRHENEAVTLDIFSSFKCVDALELTPGRVIVDEWYLGYTEHADNIEKIFEGYTAKLRKKLPISYGRSELNRRWLLWGSWNDGLWWNVSEDLLLTEAKFLKENFPLVRWVQLDSGYSALNEIIHGLGVPYEGEEGVDKQKFPRGLRHYSDAVREIGLTPAIWIGLYCPVMSKIYQDKGYDSIPITLAITNQYDHRSQSTYYTHTRRWDIGLKLFRADIEVLAEAFPNVDILIHLDHTQHDSDAELLESDLSMYSSVMYDASSLPMEQNIQKTKAYVARKGHELLIEGACDEIVDATGEARCEITDADKCAYFKEETGVDVVVANLGTEHRASGKDLHYYSDAARAIRAKIGPRICLHGTSSVSNDQIGKLFEDGICKVNIWTAMERDVAPALAEWVVKNVASLAGSETEHKLINEGYLTEKSKTGNAPSLQYFPTTVRQTIVFEEMKKIVRSYLDLWYIEK